jgi:hypothetical protein
MNTKKTNIKSGSFDIEVSHWFHGRTGGLLGVHDNERFDDMMTSDRQITSDAYALANTWQVQDKCRKNNSFLYAMKKKINSTYIL